MFLVVELLFIVLLVMILFMLYHGERAGLKQLSPRALIEEYWNGKERREHMRFAHNLEVEYLVEKKPHLKANGKTVDISLGGMRLLVDEKFSKGTILDLKVNLPGSHRVVEVEGEVVWSEEVNMKDESGKRYFHSGIKFLGIKEPAGKHLAEYLHTIGISE